jgi:hypothetical protein
MTLDDFLVYVLPEVPGCPRQIAAQAVLDAAIDFMTFSQVWNEIQDPIALVDGVYEYDLSAGWTYARAIDIREIYTPNGRLIGKTMREIADLIPNWQVQTSSEPLYYSRAATYDTIRVFPIPQLPTDSMTVDAVYTLRESATVIPDVVVQRWRRPIADGALARLQLMAGAAWFNERRGLRHEQDFERARADARITAMIDKASGSVRVPGRLFGRYS